ncbi:response regulator [Youxingia wuxianensis]|uniref:Stage 0 sporulation protein A homolog n=1 Tax=Youxingia wuxianensis TaxID=2763678 RepID=A0A926ERN0_9FIRM|nr:response regulator [Youxingia wuxianensis]MBC8585367.1 response regulator [Youxingia wuxianensis]
MIKLLIADDERDTRSVIRDMVPWEENGIRVCGEASNGKEAIHTIETQRPDIALLDIRMPLVDGLGVAKYIYENKLDMESVILSGHNEFVYAQQAMKYGVSDYLLKPCRPEDILASITHCKQRLEQNRQKENLLSNMSNQLSQDNSALNEHLLLQLLSGAGAAPGLLSLFEQSENCCFCAAAFLPQRNITQDVTARELILGELYKQFLHCETARTNGHIAVVVQMKTDDPSSLYNACLRIREKFLSEDLQVSIGIGMPVSALPLLPSSYQSALFMLEKQFFSFPGQVLSGCCEDDFSHLPYLRPDEEESRLLSAIRTGGEEQVSPIVEEFFQLFQSHPCTKANVINAVLTLLLEVYRICETCGIPVPENMENYLLYEQLEDFSTLEELKRLVLLFAQDTALKIQGKSSGSSPIHAALKYIEEHYRENIDLNILASHVHITPSYLSLMFKQTTGVNFIDHLNNTRIQKACELMKNLELKAYEISYMVGYNDEKYFSRVFKKVTGMSPSKYRKVNI